MDVLRRLFVSRLLASFTPGSIPAWAGRTFSTSYSLDGLSPRGRGNPVGINDTPHAERSIPAWAGEPTWLRCRGVLRRVYPRVGGGTPCAYAR